MCNYISNQFLAQRFCWEEQKTRWMCYYQDTPTYRERSPSAGVIIYAGSYNLATPLANLY